eukprot:scaffold179_cov368-Prasinococcus_capsulatus_cf.AAC.19
MQGDRQIPPPTTMYCTCPPLPASLSFWAAGEEAAACKQASKPAPRGARGAGECHRQGGS